jgi:UDP-GlcNAc:undecaprenyl-phosphate GlcNAc-1-phosphate transferase
MDLFELPELTRGEAAALAGGGMVLGAILASVLSAVTLRWRVQKLFADNYRGRPVPVVLGIALATAAALGIVILGAVAGPSWHDARVRGVPGAALVVLVGLGLSGAWDDLKGDERPRGFSGHLGSLRRGTLTGGVVKLIAGGISGLVAGWLLGGTLGEVLTIGLLVALSANLINLLDRGPGRAVKFSLLVLLPLFLWGPRDWTVSAAAAGGALLVVFPLDLRERGMLGDAGANPLGGLLGLGLALSLPVWGRLVAIVLLLGLNLVSERWSFDSFISRTPALRWFDGLGRLR